MERFNKVCLGIWNIMPEIAILVSVIRLCRFTESSIKRPAKDLDELRNRATKFMEIEEFNDYHRSVRSKNGGDKEKEKDGGNRPTSGRSDRHKENRGLRFFTYTPLNASRGKILDKALQAKLIPTLKQLQSSRNADTSKQCQYHRNFCHTTEGCQALKDIIE